MLLCGVLLCSVLHLSCRVLLLWFVLWWRGGGGVLLFGVGMLLCVLVLVL